MAESVNSLAALRRHIASLEGVPAAQSHARVETGHAPLDHALYGGLARGRVHEFFAATEEAAAGAGLALILGRLAAGKRPCSGCERWRRAGPEACSTAPDWRHWALIPNGW